MRDYPEPEWTAENMNRKQGDTTFQTCGWCKHVGAGSYRYGCCLDGNCDLLKSYDNDIKWNTPCRVILLGKQDIKDIIESKQYDIEEKVQGIKILKKEIKILSSLKPKIKPPLPSNRNADHFNEKDTVYVYHDKKWNRGTVCLGYRHHDGCVSYVLDNYPASKGGWGCGFAVPCVLLEWEYRYFCKNPKEFEDYLKLCDKSYNGDRLPMKDYLESLGKEK